MQIRTLSFSFSLEESFAILIALIFVNESIDKLLKIHKTHRFTNNPFLYSNEFLIESPNSTCFRCLHQNSTTNSKVFTLNASQIYRERDVISVCLRYDSTFMRKCYPNLSVKILALNTSFCAIVIIYRMFSSSALFSIWAHFSWRWA